MMPPIHRYPNPMHEAVVKQAHIAAGLPVLFAQHPFVGKPFWPDRRAA